MTALPWTNINDTSPPQDKRILIIHSFSRTGAPRYSLAWYGSNVEYYDSEFDEYEIPKAIDEPCWRTVDSIEDSSGEWWHPPVPLFEWYLVLDTPQQIGKI